MAQRNQSPPGAGTGCIGILALNIVVVFLISFLASGFPRLASPILIFAICIYQLIYVIPLIFGLVKQRNWSVMHGVIIGAVLTAFLTGPCFASSLQSPGLENTSNPEPSRIINSP